MAESTDEATTHMELSIDPTGEYISATITATPIMLVWEPTDLLTTADASTSLGPVSSPGTIPQPRETAPTTSESSTVQEGRNLSKNTVVAISVSVACSFILLVAAFWFYRASRRRSSDDFPHAQPEQSARPISNSPQPIEKVKSEMEDPVSTMELQKQSGAYQGKPELGTQVNKLYNSKIPEDNVTSPSATQDESLANPSLSKRESGMIAAELE
ncbi:hypothetical protein diail_7185 [Diaporthe ilicicola]|nr:hypothetical protein diail_7185 [Diaporthe ilicicola]